MENDNKSKDDELLASVKNIERAMMLMTKSFETMAVVFNMLAGIEKEKLERQYMLDNCDRTTRIKFYGADPDR